jgi:hypothetical protein
VGVTVRRVIAPAAKTSALALAMRTRLNRGDVFIDFKARKLELDATRDTAPPKNVKLFEIF